MKITLLRQAAPLLFVSFLGPASAASEPVCGPAIAQEYKEFSKKVMQNLKAQVVYK